MDIVTVAVGIMTDDAGRVLVSRRPMGSYQGGFWEFPGGKQESYESIRKALSRELSEELGVEIEDVESFMTVRHDYGDREVCLNVFHILSWKGEATGLEGQPIAWLAPKALRELPFLSANEAILYRLLSD